MLHAAQIVDDPIRARELTRMLERYIPQDPVEAGYQRRMLTLATLGAAAFSRLNYAPGHFTASAFVLSPDESSLLLIFHRRLRRWLQPGGHLDPDEGVFAAARREVAEETGVGEVDFLGGAPSLFDLDVHEIPPREDEPAHEHFDLRVLVRARQLNLMAASDAGAAKWVKIAEVSGIETDASVMRAVGKLRHHG
jgi:8-oxo-dGTP pyrophosphatase MutT (NUDIX family)